MTAPKNWVKKGDYFHSTVNNETHIGFEASHENRNLFKAYLLTADGRAKSYISKRWESIFNAKAEAIRYMRKHPNG